MKKVLGFVIITVLVLCSCSNKIKPEPVVIIGPNDDYEKADDPIELPDNTYIPPCQTEPLAPTPPSQPEEQEILQQIHDLSVYNFGYGDGRIVESASKSAFTSDIVFEWNNQKITIEAPIFTGIKTQNVYSYKSNYTFGTNGFVSLKTSCGYFTFDKHGNVYDYNDYKSIAHDSTLYSKYYQSYRKYGGNQVAENAMIIQDGEPGNYKQRLHTIDDKPLSEFYDCIGYFFDGLALVTRDNKIGIIDESGAEVLKPSIAFDHVEYPLPEPKQNKKMYLMGDMANNAFLTSIGGELAIINIKREPKATCDEFVKALNIDGYALKDISGDSTPELITKKDREIVVYGNNGSFFEIGRHKFETGKDLRLLECENLPGIAIYTNEGGAKRLRYLCAQNNILDIEHVFNYYYSYDVPQKFKYITEDTMLIDECKNAYNQNKDIVFINKQKE